jgi:hypothetical protein
MTAITKIWYDKNLSTPPAYEQQKRLCILVTHLFFVNFDYIAACVYTTAKHLLVFTAQHWAPSSRGWDSQQRGHWSARVTVNSDLLYIGYN